MLLDKERIGALTEAHGSPLYILEEGRFLENYRSFEACFRKRYDHYRISYSYKTNYAPYICRLVAAEGGYAEVVSDMELAIARKCGNPDSRIVYNGPGKGSLLEGFIENGGIVNVDSFAELDRILSRARSFPERTYRFGIRVNIDIGQSFVSRFGIDECDLQQVFDEVGRVENAKIIGLHCHIGQSRTVQAWRARAEIMIGLAKRFFADAPEYISLGSGMFGEMEPSLAEQFGHDLPTYEEYADAVALPFAEAYPGEKRPVLFTEPGTTLINKYISFFTKVVSIKHIKGRTFVTLDGSKHNIGEICELKKLPVRVVRMSSEAEEVQAAAMVGYTCLEHDVLYRDYSGSIGVGDYVVFDNVGGYSNVSKPPFIRPNCCMISLKDSGEVCVIKRAETTEEVIATYE